jgi:hypothetical protein
MYARVIQKAGSIPLYINARKGKKGSPRLAILLELASGRYEWDLRPVAQALSIHQALIFWVFS